MSEVLMGYGYRNMVGSFVVSGQREEPKEWIIPADIPLVENNVLFGMFFKADSPLDERNIPLDRNAP